MTTLITSCSTSQFDHSWHNFSQVSNVLPAFFTGYSTPELCDSCHELPFGGWLDFTVHILFHLIPYILDWVQIGRFRRRWPPVHGLVDQVLLCKSRRMLRIIILHEAVVLRIHIVEEWDERLIENLNVQDGIQDSIKNTDGSSASHANPCPYMDFGRVLWPEQERVVMLYYNLLTMILWSRIPNRAHQVFYSHKAWRSVLLYHKPQHTHQPVATCTACLSLISTNLPWLASRWFSPLSTTESPMAFLLYRTCVSKHHIRKVLVYVLASPLQTLQLVWLANELAVGAATKRPIQNRPTTQYCSQTQAVA